MPIIQFPSKPPAQLPSFTAPLNRYGMMAFLHMREHCPKAFLALMAQGEQATLEHFQGIEDETRQRIEVWIVAYTKVNPPAEGFVMQHQHWTMAEKLAEEEILPELILLPSESATA
jgi:hypothetical protein